MKAWLDIENPPQVQYLLPCRQVLLDRGAEVVVTARDDGYTFRQLRDRGVEFRPVGSRLGAGLARKAVGTLRRAAGLRRAVREGGTPDFVLGASRPATIAARALGIPAFVIVDYEHAHLRLYGLAGATVLHPDQIDEDVLVARGLRRADLVAFRGLKEDISFAGTDLDAVEAHRFPGLEDGPVRVLFRPPAEHSHYFRSESRDVSLAVLAALARRPDVVVVYSPRLPWQSSYLDELPFANHPVLLDSPLPFVPLLKGVDAVFSSGGTMLREAAYLGVPAFSLFRSAIGSVDRYLESLGRLRILESADEVAGLDLARGRREPVLRANPHAVQDIADVILARVSRS